MNATESAFYAKPMVEIMDTHGGPLSHIVRIKYYLKNSDGGLGELRCLLMGSVSLEEARKLEAFVDEFAQYI